MTSNMIYIFALGVGLKCPHNIHLNTQCPSPVVLRPRDVWNKSQPSPYVPPGLRTFELPPLSTDVHSGAKIGTKIQNSYWIPDETIKATTGTPNVFHLPASLKTKPGKKSPNQLIPSLYTWINPFVARYNNITCFFVTYNTTRNTTDIFLLL